MSHESWTPVEASAVTFCYGSFTLICDAEDFKFIKAHISTVVVKPDGRISYVALSINSVPVKLHRHLLQPPADMYVDHINGNTLDNRKCNLRICTNAQNQMNARPHEDKKSKLPKGVCRAKSNPGYPYQVRLSWNGTRIQVGYFKTVEQAEAAYLKAVEFYHEQFAFHISRKEEVK
jgi:hypothetical protein